MVAESHATVSDRIVFADSKEKVGTFRAENILEGPARATSYLARETPWISISGVACSGSVRLDNSQYGCPGYITYSSGVVCDQSSAYQSTHGLGDAPYRPGVQAVDNQLFTAPENPPNEVSEPRDSPTHTTHFCVAWAASTRVTLYTMYTILAPTRFCFLS